jgi:hypothetical protein
MITRAHPNCYGAMFPIGREAPETGPGAGKALHVVRTNPVGMAPAVKRVEVDSAGWDECVHCPQFDECYRLSMAKLSLQTALHS